MATLTSSIDPSATGFQANAAIYDDLLKTLRQGDDNAPVIMISGHATIRDAVEATQSGAPMFSRHAFGDSLRGVDHFAERNHRVEAC